MKLGTFLRCLCIASGVVAGAAIAVARTRAPRKKVDPPPCPAASAETSDLPARRDYFSITKMRGTARQPKWLLQGFGRYQCFLLFDSWQDAMDQVSFRIDKLAAPDLIQLT